MEQETRENAFTGVSPTSRTTYAYKQQAGMAFRKRNGMWSRQISSQGAMFEIMGVFESCHGIIWEVAKRLQADYHNPAGRRWVVIFANCFLDHRHCLSAVVMTSWSVLLFAKVTSSANASFRLRHRFRYVSIQCEKWRCQKERKQK